MKKVVLTQEQVDKLIIVERVVVKPSVLGVGLNDVVFKTSNGGKAIWQYKLWKGMLDRCFSEKVKMTNPSYKDVTCCDEWLSFGNFLAWCNKEVGYKGKPEGYCLDKDLIIKGNKTYSPEACSFVPMSVNKLFTGRKKREGNYPIGVHWHSRNCMFEAQLSYNGKQKQVGSFCTPEEAFAAYKVAKEAQIKAVANQYRGVIKPAVFDLLMGWEVD